MIGDIIDLCAGVGGLSAGLAAVTGAQVRYFAETDPAADAVLKLRYPGVRNLGDVKLIDWSRLPRSMAWLCAGYPCQPWSAAGLRLGVDDPRHLWPWIARGIDALRPQFVLLENVLGHVKAGLPDVLAELAGMGYGGAWTVNRAMDVGAPHSRRRVFVLATRHAAPGFCEVNSFGVPGVVNPYLLLPTPQARDGKGQPSHGGFNVSNLPRAVLALPGDGTYGEYAPAVEHWAAVIGTPAPVPAVPNGRGGRRTNPALSEWMMGFPSGHVTGVPGLGIHALNRLTGNGVVWLQAAHAVHALMRTVSQLPRLVYA